MLLYVGNFSEDTLMNILRQRMAVLRTFVKKYWMLIAVVCASGIIFYFFVEVKSAVDAGSCYSNEAWNGLFRSLKKFLRYSYALIFSMCR